MKKIALSLLFVFATLFSFGQKYSSFGEKIKAKGAEPIATIEGKREFAAEPVKIEGEVESVCQMKGCWMKIKKTDGSTMTVKFKDYDFFVPMDITGKKVIFEGTPKIKTTSVAELKHYAEDAKLPQSEIDKITKPKEELSFVATGVLVPKD